MESTCLSSLCPDSPAQGIAVRREGRMKYAEQSPHGCGAHGHTAGGRILYGRRSAAFVLRKTGRFPCFLISEAAFHGSDGQDDGDRGRLFPVGYVRYFGLFAGGFCENLAV